MNIDLNLIFPEIFLSLSIMSLLMIGVFKKNSSNLIFNLSILTLFILAALILNLSSVNKILIFNNSYVIDDVANFMKISPIPASNSSSGVLFLSSQYRPVI